MEFELWTLLVEILSGGYWISILVIGLLIFFILAVFGKVSKLTTIFYTMIYVFTMVMAFGYKWITALIFFAILVWAYLSFKNYTNN